MKDILKKLAAAGATIGGLEYIKYRFNGGRPLLENTLKLIRRVQDFRNRIECKEPITLKADDCKIV